jgi:hypothetical protein
MSTTNYDSHLLAIASKLKSIGFKLIAKDVLPTVPNIEYFSFGRDHQHITITVSDNLENSINVRLSSVSSTLLITASSYKKAEELINHQELAE